MLNADMKRKTIAFEKPPSDKVTFGGFILLCIFKNSYIVLELNLFFVYRGNKLINT